MEVFGGGDSTRELAVQMTSEGAILGAVSSTGRGSLGAASRSGREVLAPDASSVTGVAASVAVRAGRVQANGLEFGVLEAGSGPLALCLHGFPDTAHTWVHLLPALAGAGF